MRAIAELERVVDVLQADDGRAPDAVMLDDLRALRRQIDRLEAVFTQRVTAAHEAGAADAEGFATTAAFLRHECHLSGATARARVDVGLGLSRRPAVAVEFAAGTISYAHAKVITEALTSFPEKLQADAEPVLLEAARSYDPSRVGEVARRLRHIIDPDGQAGVDERHYENRWFELPVTFRGVGVPRGLLDPESAAIVRTAIDALSTKAGALDERTPAQRRADALVELARRALDSGDLPESGGERPHLNVNVDFASLTGETRTPGEMNVGGSLGHDAVRRIACDASVNRIVTASPGGVEGLPRHYFDALPPPLRGASQILDVGRSSRTATAPIRKALAARDKGCVMPGCDRPPSRCEAHHKIHWSDGGITALHNLVLLCAYHHHFVHEYRWHIHLHDDGTVTVTPPPPAQVA
jgi:hypothetical protein